MNYITQKNEKKMQNVFEIMEVGKNFRSSLNIRQQRHLHLDEVCPVYRINMMYYLNLSVSNLRNKS